MRNILFAVTCLLISYPAFAGAKDLLFETTFDEDQLDLDSTWHLEGTGQTAIHDGTLTLREDPEGVGVVLWLRKDWPNDFHLAFDLSFSNNQGIGVFFFAATGADGSDALTGTQPRTGNYDEYIHGDLHCYGMSLHRYWPDGRNNPGANLRRHPGFHLLSQAMPDPALEAERTYRIEIVKTGPRIRIFVDHKKIHDVVDDGALGPPLQSGKIGFRLRGHHSCIMRLDNITIRKPESSD